MNYIATIRKQRERRHSPALSWNLLLAQKAKQQSYQIDKDVQLFPINLNKEGFVANLHLGNSFQPPTRIRWGLIALSAIALRRAIYRAPQLCNQVALKGEHQPFQDSRGGAA